MFEKPAVASKCGQILKKQAQLHLGRMIMERNQEGRQDVSDSLIMYESQWRDIIGREYRTSDHQRKEFQQERGSAYHGGCDEIAAIPG